MFYWPRKGAPQPPADVIAKITLANGKLTFCGLLADNRQFWRNIRDYAYLKINYVAWKVLNVSHVTHTVPAKYGTDPNSNYIAMGVNSITDSYPVYFNWDVEQDFINITGKEGVVDSEGFNQHPTTKSMKPCDKKPISFVYKVPHQQRIWLSTDTFKNSSSIDNSNFGDAMESLTGVRNARAPRNFWVNSDVSNFWNQFLPSSQDYLGIAIKTVIDWKFYLGVSFRGRRLMDDNSETSKSCTSSFVFSNIESQPPTESMNETVVS